jgi:hypothetical protein
LVEKIRRITPKISWLYKENGLDFECGVDTDSIRKNYLIRRSFDMRIATLRKMMTVMVMALVAGCIAVIPIMIKKHEEEGFVTVQFEVQGNATDLYAKSVDYTLKKNPDIKLVKDDRNGLSFEGQSLKDGRTYDMKWTVKQLDGGKSQFDFQAKGTEGDKLVDAATMGAEADKAVNNFCDALQKKCEIAPAAK